VAGTTIWADESMVARRLAVVPVLPATWVVLR
jgi:hypothetical protein